MLYLIAYCLQRLYLFDVDFRLNIVTRTFLSPGLLFVFIGFLIRERSILEKVKMTYKLYFFNRFINHYRTN